MRLYIKTDLADMKDQDFFKALGQHISELRQEHGMTQAELAEALGLRQQVIASYENATRRLPASLLVPVAERLAVSVEDLLGLERSRPKPGPVPKLHRQFEALTSLPKSEQQFFSQMIERFLTEAKAS
jgi:transcriptional regulator with XRE-family HTH domain